MLVAGAGLAGLAAARDLAAMGARVTVVEARDRVGGRVLTAREGFIDRQHAEAGADMINAEDHELHPAGAELGLKPNRILRSGWAYARPDASGKPRLISRSGTKGWDRLVSSARRSRRLLSAGRAPLGLSGDDWRSDASRWRSGSIKSTPTRSCDRRPAGFAVSSWPTPSSCHRWRSSISSRELDRSSDNWGSESYRIEGGNDRLATAMAAALGDRLHLRTEVAALRSAAAAFERACATATA